MNFNPSLLSDKHPVGQNRFGLLRAVDLHLRFILTPNLEWGSYDVQDVLMSTLPQDAAVLVGLPVNAG